MKKKLIIYSVIAVVAITVIIIVYVKVEKFIENKRKQKELDDDAKNAKAAKSITITESQAQSISDSLKEAFGNWGWGTNEKAVYSSFDKVNTVGDVYLIMSKFGTPSGHTLAEWINKELNNDEKEVINRKLTDKNINYQF